MNKHTLLKRASIMLIAICCLPVQAAPLDISAVPLFLSNRVDPNVLFNMSIETPMGGAAYSGPNGATNYSSANKYLGYFDSNKCYTYSSDRFNPVSATAADYTCSGQWSGNLLNWAAMTAIDEFRWALTGGDRYVDTATETVIERARAQNNSSWYPIKRLNAGVNVAPSTVTPYSDATIFFTNHNAGKAMKVGTTSNGTQKGTLNVRVKVCDSSVGLERNCTGYGTSNKPTGLIQNYASKMRFGLSSYLNDGSQSRDGGVIRSKMKYTGPNKYVIGTGTVANPNKEWSEVDGTFIANPDTAEATASGVSRSGVINYINKFGASSYKSYDPIGELFYESLRYFKNLGPTPEYFSGLTNPMKDGFPVITTWDDPIQAWCQKNFMVAINDANPWLDKKLPGTFFTCDKAGTAGMPASFKASDCGEPSNPDTSINVTTLTNTVGQYEGLNNALWRNTGTWTSGSQSGTNDSVGYFAGAVSPGSCVNKTITNLGEVMGTCPATQKENSYYIAGLAYYANTQDIRPDLEGKQTLVTYMIDTQEYNANPLDGPKNMLWLAGKYGGFIDSNNDGNPNISSGGSTTSEWDADGDGEPDNYVLATETEKMVNGLIKSFDDIIKRTGSASSVATSTTELTTGTTFFQAQFASGEWSGTLTSSLVSNPTTPVWDAATKLNTLLGSDSDSREIITKSDGVGKAFAYAGLSATDKAFLDADETGTADGRGTDRVGYLRGHSQHEGTAAGTFRQRAARKMGDVINSNPWFAGAPNAGYSDLDYGGYSAFRQSLSGRLPMVYVGANDGMLHAFNACEVGVTYGTTPCTSAMAGSEMLAYVPSVVYPNLSKLTGQSYKDTHLFFVDGSPMVSDAYVDGSWRSVLVSGLNSGGKGYFALDVTNPADTTKTGWPTFSEDNAASILLWEFTSVDDADLGLTYNLPSYRQDTGYPNQIVRLANNKWAVIVGNGYNSSNGKAALFILFLDGPDSGTWTLNDHYIKIVADSSGSNGLSTPTPFDTNGDGFVDTVYAGDLKGNLWKFMIGPNPVDASVTNVATTWKVAFNGSPLFTATDAEATPNPQPIISPPVVSLHPQGGQMVLFGTGKYLEQGDLSDTLTQSFYGIHDNSTSVSATVVLSRAELDEQVLTSTFPRDVSSTNEVAVTDPPTEPRARGWYADLSIPGERLVGRPFLFNGLIFFDTIVPSTEACTGGVTSALMALNYLDGSAAGYNVFLDASGNAITIEDDDGNPDNNRPAIGISTGSALGGSTFIKSSKTKDYIKFKVLSSQLEGGGIGDDNEVQTLRGRHGRINWREIIQ